MCIVINCFHQLLIDFFSHASVCAHATDMLLPIQLHFNMIHSNFTAKDIKKKCNQFQRVVVVESEEQ